MANTQKKIKKVPMRQCVGCGQMQEKNSLYRVLKTENGEILLDKSGKMNGRGAYICANEECLAKAIKKKGFERSFQMKIPEDVYVSLTKEMQKDEA